MMDVEVVTEVSGSMVCACVVVAGATERMFGYGQIFPAPKYTLHSRTNELLHLLTPPPT
jgi:hypothetical protein